jgi:O-Antigen ligase
MALTKLNWGRNWGPKTIHSVHYRRAWLIGFLVLPFASYLSLGILVILILIALIAQPKRNFATFWQQGFGLFSLGMLFSSALALHPGNAFLQLANFLPYFFMVAVLSGSPGILGNPLATLQRWAYALLYATLPINALALVEYILKLPRFAATTEQWPWFSSWFAVNFGHRAHAMFDHPNGLSSYLVMILGLGLGLVLQQSQTAQPIFAQVSTKPSVQISTKPSTKTSTKPSTKTSGQQVGLTYLATFSCLVGIFCTGSRNGILIALTQLLVVGCFARRSRWLVLAGLMVVGAIVTSTLWLGVGGRQISLALMTQDPRVMVWQMAFSLIQQRPWVGWGLGGFNALYIPDSIPGYPSIFHAHNLWLYLASEVGIPLMLGFSIILGRFYGLGLKTVFRAKTTEQHRTLLIGYLLAFSGYLMFGLFDVVLFDSRIHTMSWLLLACIGILGKLPAQLPDSHRLD